MLQQESPIVWTQRHTDRSVSSTPYAVLTGRHLGVPPILTWMGGGGRYLGPGGRYLAVPSHCPYLDGGRYLGVPPPPILTRTGGRYLGVPPILAWMGGRYLAVCTSPPYPLWTDWKHYLPHPYWCGGNNRFNVLPDESDDPKSICSCLGHIYQKARNLWWIDLMKSVVQWIRPWQFRFRSCQPESEFSPNDHRYKLALLPSTYFLLFPLVWLIRLVEICYLSSRLLIMY